MTTTVDTLGDSVASCFPRESSCIRANQSTVTRFSSKRSDIPLANKAIYNVSEVGPPLFVFRFWRENFRRK